MELKPKFNYRLTTILIALATFLIGFYGIVSDFSGLLLTPVVAALLAVLLAFDKKKIISICTSALLVGVDIFLGISLLSVISVISASIIYMFFAKNWRKSECAGILTIIIFIAIVFLAYVAAFVISGAHTLDSFLDFYMAEFDRLEVIILDYIAVMKESGQLEGYDDFSDPEALREVIRNCFKAIIAFVAVISFAVSGIALKLFSILTTKLSANTDKILAWRFIPSSVFGYFYLILVLISAFLSDVDSIFALSVINLEIIFMFVFAYIGIMFVNGILIRGRKSPILSFVIILSGFLILSSLALRLLSITGAIIIIMHSKIENTPEFKFMNNQTNKKE